MSAGQPERSCVPVNVLPPRPPASTGRDGAGKRKRTNAQCHVTLEHLVLPAPHDLTFGLRSFC